METVKPKLYIDVDGVLFGMYNDQFQLRPDAMGFLRWAIQHFECFWLTSWGHGDLRDLLRLVYGVDIINKITYCKWGILKTDAVDFTGKWFWIEDGLRDREVDILRARGLLDNYIFVNPVGRDELEFVRDQLMLKL